ncbi:hypothetical protein AGABI1DRAFT_133176 [Agaricus bisporus var. burnettii JB137-S8]|uniref:Uncharacterized protein n=1 Tax=Agaricus bisporus var. burnettii (strain JB137-S8 / ATCC MYA-4627 / FGSC 10392) TaxID=597362 RepID=K5VJH9_AGABU|nr:uncharacterized protein AGABI1DRAFT_133176 [Agaricus bisporus var. burnettii JB137-S8]EKM74509.1 hypothetical protein AGABI1DRAFT_133176 [Agaricus bisporus var. burnettii JB137-S8]
MGAMTAVAGLMPLHLQLKKLFERSVIRINTLHPHHPVLSLLERRKAKGSTLHPNALERKSKTIRKVIKSPLDSVIDNPSSEIFDPLSEHIKPGHRLVDRYPDKVKFVLMPKNCKNRDKYHNNLNLAPIKEPNTLHLFTAGVKHKFDPNVSILHRTHSHISLVTVFNGRAVTSKTRAAGRRVNEETIVRWSTFLALIKAHKKLQKGWPISKVVLYTTSQLIVKNLMSTNSKPLGSQLSIAVSLAFNAIATDFPEVDIVNKETETLNPSLNRAEDITPSIIHLPHVPMSCELDRFVQKDRSTSSNSLLYAGQLSFVCRGSSGGSKLNTWGLVWQSAQRSAFTNALSISPPIATRVLLGSTFTIPSWALRPAPTLARRSSSVVGIVKSAARLPGPVPPCAPGA